MKSNSIKIFQNCSYCQSQVHILLSLGSLPPVNVMSRIDEEFHGFTAYPLTWALCKHCGLVQILEELSSESVFPNNYPYLSGSTRILRDNFTEQSKQIQQFLDLTKSDLVVDIGSNDGTLLSNYQKFSKVLGVEPTNAADVALKRDIPTVKQFFTTELVSEILNEHGKAKVITACNVFAHIPNLPELMAGISKLLADDGVFISESHYLYSLLETLQFDTIYHEHLRYYSVKFLTKLFEDYGFEIINISRISTHGGSIRVWAARKGAFEVQDSVKISRTFESKEMQDSTDQLQTFVVNLKAWRQEFRKVIADLALGGKVIAAIGAPSRASTLISFAGLTNLDIAAVGEIQGSHKIGRFMPGTTIPIVLESEVIASNPDYLLVLSWHIAEELIPKIRERGFKGKFIIPLPYPEIVY
jgi:hypothetical protein